MIIFSVQNNTAIIRLNRPEKRNALHSDLVSLLKEYLGKAAADDNVRSVILTGEGKAFCAGADLAYLNDLAKFSAVENEKDSEKLAELFLQVYKFPKPTIASVNGAAIAGGCGLASVCDFIIAHPEKSKFGYTEVKIGFMPAIVSLFLIKRVGEGLAKQLLLSGEIIDGGRAYEIGFANYLSDDPLARAIELAEQIKNSSAYSMSLTKSMISGLSNMSVDEAVDYCIRLNTISRSAEDFKNGLNNFLNKK